MDMSLFTTICLFVVFGTSLSTQTATYKAAIVDYNVKSKITNIDKHIEENIQNYINLIKKASNQNVDIIIFPKSTLNEIDSIDSKRLIEYACEIPYSPKKISPCDSKQYDKILTKLSCEAKMSKMYVFVNVLEKSCQLNDGNCLSDDYTLYNTNIVLNRKGEIISKHRTTNSQEIETFTTDFGVTFAHVTNFDILEKSTRVLLEDKRVRDFIVASHWRSKLPFSTSVQYRQSWVYTNNVNLLVSGVNSPSLNSSGSGIYQGTFRTNKTDDEEVLKTKLLIISLNEDRSAFFNASIIHNPEAMKDEDVYNSFKNFFSYILNKLQILTFIVAIYILEMM